MAEYHDHRSDFWRSHFEQALEYEPYLAASDPQKADRWREMARQIPALTGEEARRLKGFKRELHVLTYSGVWCGDCVRQGPMLQRIAEACGPAVRHRVIERDVSTDLQEELRILGALRVPMVVFLTEDFFEIGRFGDRLLTVYRGKALRELGPACDLGIVPPPANQLQAEQSEWVDVFERMLLMARLSPPLRARHAD